MVLQINRFDTALMGSEEDLARKQIEFDQTHCTILPKLLEPKLLQSVLRGVDQANFIQTKYAIVDAGDVHIESEYPTSYLLNFLMNNQTMFDTIQQLTGCDQIGMFEGRIYRMMPIPDHYDTWHDDLAYDRMIALSINLSPEPYSGGLVQICDWESRQIIKEVHNTSLGDAMIFRLAPHLKHRVTSVTGSVPRTVFAGWFHSAPDYCSRVQSGNFNSENMFNADLSKRLLLKE